MGWVGIENGILLARAAAARFDAVLTKDTKLQYEQNLTNLPLAVVILRAASNDIEDLRLLTPSVLCALNSLPPKSIARIP